ncbi:hypothetical protein V5799_018605 [Amblyomma americanum]|uniref:BRISC and BRCA1-A complex member 2 n=1 Tax=Amblyomma americanum TaxID=6943 RepID=A0AAQ4EYS6_AMBAM
MQNLTTPHPIRLVSASHGGPRDGTQQLCDRFKISLPYAGQAITWEVIFQAHRPELPPDFIFDDTAFQPNIEELPSLCDWNSEDDQALTNVVQELLEQYRKHQVSMLDDSPRLQFEYSSLVHQSDIAESNIQVHLNKKNPGTPVRFWITLPIDFSRLPPVFAKVLLIFSDLLNVSRPSPPKFKPLLTAVSVLCLTFWKLHGVPSLQKGHDRMLWFALVPIML